MRAYAAGRVTLVNAPGNGCADDKAVYPFVPDMIRYYLGEEPILAQVDTFVCARDRRPARTCSSTCDQLVVKAVDEAGGYGMLMGPQASAAERDEFRRAHPGRAPQLHRPAPRRAVDLPDLGSRPGQAGARAGSTCGRSSSPGPSGSWVLPGGLTRVALVEGSYVVNSQPGRRLQGHLGAEGEAAT